MTIGSVLGEYPGYLGHLGGGCLFYRAYCLLLPPSIHRQENRVPESSRALSTPGPFRNAHPPGRGGVQSFAVLPTTARTSEAYSAWSIQVRGRVRARHCGREARIGVTRSGRSGERPDEEA